MKKSLVFGAGRGPRLAVLERIKCSGSGMSVQDLATALEMSYMGIKSHCIALASSGHLITAREASNNNDRKGRPRLLYKLADQGEKLFAEAGDHLALALLKEAAGLYGATAPQKLLLMFFRSQTACYREKITVVSVRERAGMLVQFRDQEGRMSTLEESGSWSIRESHNPLASLMEIYPEARALEEHSMSEVLGITVKRREEGGKVIFSSLAQCAP